MPVDPIDPSVTEALRGVGLQLHAGVQLDKALRLAGDVARTDETRAAFADAVRRAQAGESFDKILAALASVLSPGERAVLNAGWEAGRVDPALEQVIGRREVMYETRKQVRSQLVMPAMMLLGAAFIAPLPGMLLGRTGLLMYLFMALTPVGLAVLLFRWAKSAGYIPGARQKNLSDFGLLMSNLLGAGVRLLDALPMTAAALPEGEYRDAVNEAHRRVTSGQPLSEAMRSGPWPEEWLSAITVGEVGGNEDVVLGRLGESARLDYLDAVRAWGKWMPKAVYAVVALYIAVQVIRMWASVMSYQP